MLFVRGIMGNVKINPAIKYGGGLLLFVSIVFGGLAYQAIEHEQALADCREMGGIWIGSTPGGLSLLARIRLHQGRCEFSTTQAKT